MSSRSCIFPVLLFYVVISAGCGLALDDPLPFQDLDAQVGDAAVDVGRVADRFIEEPYVPPDRPDPDEGLPPDVTVDAAVVEEDAAPEVDAAPDPDLGPAPDGCAPADEVCDGVDNDCDDAVDEAFPESCQPCGRPGQQGVCGLGAFVCVDGALACGARLPAADDLFACDLVDADCDGTVDEAGEQVRAPGPLEQTVLEACGALDPVAAPVDDCSAEPRRVGCNAAHACVAPNCRTNCEDTRSTGSAACEGACPDMGDAAAVSACFGNCRAEVAAGFLRCLAGCGEVDQLATRWACADAAEGAACEALDCPDGLRANGQGCEPATEICNNGLDDDGDGLIDGTVAGADPCMADFAPEGPQAMGLCPDPDAPGCEDTAAMAAGGSTDGEESCGDVCPREVELSYRFAVDREEVSIRAWQACVESGCCRRPSGDRYRRAVEAIEDDRDDGPARCVPAVDPDDPEQAHLLPDLPVTGITWCQARDYCNWVGKRLPTEFEWERAAVGAERRPHPWGAEAPAACPSQQCCANADFADEPPGQCGGELPICDANGARSACLATYGGGACAEVRGPAPVFANADGANAAGLLNLGGNVSEWVFDWAAPYAGLADEDPVGGACDPDAITGQRVTRDASYATREGLRLVERRPVFATARSPRLGFRCARTLAVGDRVCDARVPEVPEACRPLSAPGAPGEVPQLACPGPDFAVAGDGDARGCDDGRAGSGDCAAAGPPRCVRGEAGCGAFLLTRLTLKAGVFERETADLLDTVLDGTLAPAGESTLALALPEDFGAEDATWPAALGTAAVVDGRLVWEGPATDVGCGAEALAFEVVTEGERVRPVCGTAGRGRLHLRAAPVSLAFSAVGLTVTRANGRLRGAASLVVTEGDLDASIFGDAAGARALVDRLGLQSQDLCDANLRIAVDCFGEPLTLPACDGGECDDPARCRGYVLPFDYEAEPAAGLPGLDCAGP